MADLNDFDELDRRIIEQLSTSSEGSFRQIAKILGVHPTTLIQRVKNLKNKGVITGYRAKIDYMKLGFGYMGFVNICIKGDIDLVQETLATLPQVLGVYSVTGEYDLLAWVACRDREEFSNTIKEIMAIEGVRRTNTSIIMDNIKDPFDYVPELV